MNVPQRLNHRRRVVIFWDRNFSALDHFVVSPYIEQAAAKGWLNDQEKRELTRSLMHYMSHDYTTLPQYPDEFVNIKPRNVLAQDNRATPVPVAGDAQAVKEMPVVKDVETVKDVQPEKDARVVKDVADAPTILRQMRSSSVRKVTLTPEMMPHYLVFREVMAVLLKSLKENERSSEEVRDLVLAVARDMNLAELEPLLQTWAEQDFSLEALPVLIEQPTTQLLVQLFYRAACEVSTPPVARGLLMDRVKVTEIPEIVR
jgi:hypothetical protein